ncbi:MAG: PAS domain S-box protein, partial [Mesorhizobium sp.]|nr:PAS domain S-box protein [Mesorhizobium sp.]
MSHSPILAGFKARQIENWLTERHGDSAALAGSRGFVERVASLEGDRDRLASLHAAYAYESVVLLGSRGQVLLEVGAPMEFTDALLGQVRGMASAGTVQMGNPYLNASGRPGLLIVVPLARKGIAGSAGTVLLRVNPQLFLNPLVESWPAASRSGETALVRREGDTALFLTELRHRKGTALKFTRPLGETGFPAAAAARSTGGGSIKGLDYRGVPVLSAWEPVAGTDWKLVAKVDLEEALAATVETALWAAAVALLGAMIVALTVLMLFRQQRVAQRLAAQIQADTLLRQFYDLPFVGMAITAPGSKRWLNFNDRLCTMLGYTREELAARAWEEMTHPEDLARDVAEYERVMRGESEGYRMDKRFLRKDGSAMFARMDIKCVRNPAGAVEYFVCMVEDISEQEAAQAKVLRLSRLYRTLSECNAAVVLCASEAELYAEVCRAAVESGGFKMAWIGQADPATRMIVPVASFGANLEYLQGIRISVDADHPNGLGPTGTAIREGQPFWCQDFANDPRTTPWHARGAEYGWGASAGLPLRRAGV